MDFLLYLYSAGVCPYIYTTIYREIHLPHTSAPLLLLLYRASNILDSRMWITFWEKAWKFGVLYLYLLCKTMRDMKTIKDLGLTKLEETILSCLIDGLYAEPGFSDVDAKDIALEVGINIKSVRGGVGSLVKKGLIWVEETETWGIPKSQQFQIIYLRKEYHYLHPEWCNE